MTPVSSPTGIDQQSREDSCKPCIISLLGSDNQDGKCLVTNDWCCLTDVVRYHIETWLIPVDYHNFREGVYYIHQKNNISNCFRRTAQILEVSSLVSCDSNHFDANVAEGYKFDHQAIASESLALSREKLLTIKQGTRTESLSRFEILNLGLFCN